MARPEKQPPTSSSLVPAILRHAEARGLDVEALALRFDLPADAARRDEVNVAADAPDELLHAVARAAAEPDVAVRVAARLESQRHTLVELAVRATASVREGLHLLARWAPLLHEGLAAVIEEDAHEARWLLSTPRRPRGVGRYVHELALAHALHHLRAGAGELAPARVWFTHARPAELTALRAFFGAGSIEFGAETCGFAVPRADLDRVMRLADARALSTLAPLVDAALDARPRGASFAERVAAHVAASLPRGTDVQEVALALHMSARTLQRRLDQEQTRFSDVLDDTRLAVARRLLGDPQLTLTDVAFRLGFADLATFTRAFKRWTGKPPGQWRRS
ncbi:Transcriptional regulator, AraC family protein [Minicystis rosea]|nr:Transcriptional regulator, AraC family protein [Minicystis rosea]